MPGTPRLLIFGIDGMPPGLLRRWSAQGHLPHLSCFAAESATSALRCTWPPHTATGWPSLFNGRLPGEHGLIQFWDCQDPDYSLRLMERAEAGVSDLWDVLADHGWTLGLLNIPMSHPPGPWPGYQITWPLAPTVHYIQPPEMARELRRAGGLTRPDIACMYDASPDYPERVLDYIEGRTQAVRHLIEHRPTDALVVVYTELDRVLHHYWHAMDPHHEIHADSDPKHRSVILQTFRAIDEAFGQVLERVDDDCAVLVMSDHGFGPGDRNVRIHHLLAEGGFCAYDSPEMIDDPVSADRELEITGRLPELRWQETRAYMPCPGSFGVNLNLEGRQSQGIVPAADRRGVEDELCNFLLGLRDRDGEQPLFTQVVRSETAYSGPFADRAPDLLLVPTDPAVSVLCDLTGPTWTVGGQTGLHRLEGVWMLRAPGVEAVDSAAAMPMEAVAGELLAIFGIESERLPRRSLEANDQLEASGLPPTAWSESLDRSLDSLVTGDPASREPTSRDRTTGARRASAAGETDETGPSAVEKEEILRRLKTMGYL